MSEIRKIDYAKDLWMRQKTVKKDGNWTVEGRPVVSVDLKQATTPSNIPGKSYISLLVTAPPDAATPPHNHNGAAVIAQVMKGRVVSQMIHTHRQENADGTFDIHEEDSGPQIYGPGDTWYEAPGCHHVRSENPYDEEAQFYATFVIDSEKMAQAKTPREALVIYDADNEDGN